MTAQSCISGEKREGGRQGKRTGKGKQVGRWVAQRKGKRESREGEVKIRPKASGERRREGR